MTLSLRGEKNINIERIFLNTFASGQARGL